MSIPVRDKQSDDTCQFVDDARHKSRSARYQMSKHLKAARASSVAAVTLGSMSLALPNASSCRSAAFAMLLAPLFTAVACAETAEALRLVCSTKSCVFSTCGFPIGASRIVTEYQRLLWQALEGLVGRQSPGKDKYEITLAEVDRGAQPVRQSHGSFVK